MIDHSDFSNLRNYKRPKVHSKHSFSSRFSNHSMWGPPHRHPNHPKGRQARQAKPWMGNSCGNLHCWNNPNQEWYFAVSYARTVAEDTVFPLYYSSNMEANKDQKSTIFQLGMSLTKASNYPTRWTAGSPKDGPALDCGSAPHMKPYLFSVHFSRLSSSNWIGGLLANSCRVILSNIIMKALFNLNFLLPQSKKKKKNQKERAVDSTWRAMDK